MGKRQTQGERSKLRDYGLDKMTIETKKTYIQEYLTEMHSL